ncbi:MAG: methyltransferase domain-containing protein, partial [Propionicimonas sp.]|nr:methyltransferase domain-containing protein [Propionicimonas sp.]
MTSPNPSGFPVAALDWLALPGATSVLAVGAGSVGIARRLATPEARIAAVDRDVTRAAAAAAHRPDLTVVAGSPDAIPFAPCLFDQVVIADLLHTLAPRLTLAEFARVLRPGGTLAVVHTGRDDSVPWVRRLGGILRSLDPRAMTDSGYLGTEAAMAHNQYFREVEQRSF